MKNTNKPKNITCRIVNTGVVMQVNTINELVFPGYFKIDACNVTTADGLPEAIDGTCLSAYLEVSDTNHISDNLKSAAVGQTLFCTDGSGGNAAYHRSGISRNGRVEWSSWVELGAATTADIQDGAITAQKLSADVLAQINNNTAAIGAERTRAMGQEGLLNDAFEAERQRAVQAEGDAAVKGKQQALRALFVAAGAEYNGSGTDVTKTTPWGEDVIHKAGHYYLNGLGDITEDQMMEIYNYRDLVFSLDCSRVAQQLPVRTFYSAYIRSGTIAQLLERRKLQGYSSFHSCSNLEVLWFTKSTKGLESVSLDLLPATNILSATFSDCSSLKIIGGINCLEVSSFNETFKGCSSLVEVRLYKIGKNVSFENSANISKSSILYIVQYAVPTSAITILLHSFAYARLAGDTDIVAALEAQPLVNIVCA